MRLAHTIDGQLTQFSWHDLSESNHLGNVYAAEVHDVLPGIDGAFLELGDTQRAFLKRSGIPTEKLVGQKTKLSDVVKPGQPMVVQLERTSIEQKQPLVSGKLRLLGFSLVHLPQESGIFFSKKFKGDKTAIKTLLERFGSGGWVVRSAAVNHDQAFIEKDAKRLRSLAQTLSEQVESKPGLIWQPPQPESWLMDQGGILPEHIFLDCAETYTRLKAFLEEYNPMLALRLRLHNPEKPMFETYKLQSQIDKLQEHKLWLPSGGSINISPTPALVAIDVNSGKQKKQRGAHSAQLKTNLEAIKLIANQLKLRNLGGQIVIDFIDLRSESELKTLEFAAKKAFAKDPAKIDMLGINRFGLLCMTRSRSGPDLSDVTMENCRVCQGSGKLTAFKSLVVKLQTDLFRNRDVFSNQALKLTVHPLVAKRLDLQKSIYLLPVEREIQCSVKIVAESSLAFNCFALTLLETGSAQV